MNIFGWQARSRQAKRESALADVLPRVRLMREQGDWESSVPPVSQEQRRQRVASAREKVVYPVLPPGVAPRRKLGPQWALPLLLLALGAWVVGALITSPLSDGRWPTHQTHSFFFQLAYAPPFLSEELALSKSREALSSIVPDASVLIPIENKGARSNVAPDGKRDKYLRRYSDNNPYAGAIVYEYSGTAWTVSMQLVGNQLGGTISWISWTE